MLTSDEPDVGSGNRPTGNDVQYLFQVVKTIRGREAATRAKLANEGWEFLSQTQGTLRTEMTFRRVKPQDPLQRILMVIATGWAAFRRLSPKLQRRLLAGLGVVILLGIGIVVASLGGDDTPGPTAAPTTASTTSAAEPSTAPATPSAEPSAAATTSPAEPTVTDITVDGLVDKINAANMKVGDQFRLTGELVGSRFWATGASGDFFVTLKTKEGSDLIVFVEQSAAKKWQDGTKVEMVVENVERTISGETTDGWLDASSVKTIAGGTTKKAKPAAPRPKLSDALSEYTTTLNTIFGTTVIDGIGPGSADGVFYVNLNLGFASLSKLEAQTTIKTINSQLVDVAADINSGTPIMKYYLAGDVVAENRYIMDPWDVTFEGMLDD